MTLKSKKYLFNSMDKRAVDRLLDETDEGEQLKVVLENKFEALRSYMYDAYPVCGNVGLGAYVAMFYEDDYIFPQRKRMSETSPQEWAELRQLVFTRDNYTCVYCGKRGGELEVDHKKPFIRGGTETIDNLVTSCVRCNRQKRDKNYEEFLKQRLKDGKQTKKAN